ncbi:MFS transporter [Pseudonocardia humida]|uniref:MFS transporter n=1 Tax=Pseudonocardia humida TaxID=2800819 RepID=A0ABT1A055_9PSEU|nr:MFS transporter [Pseudonocardia humida]MCO1656387.1 MFS transporter [Pseudonocardia humida]
MTEAIGVGADPRAADGAAGAGSLRHFVAVAAIIVLFLATASAPSPLYVVYQRLWGFSSGVLTVVFAVYVVGLLGSLLVVGGLSDHVGRRPVLGAAIGLQIVALALFVVAGDVVVLSVARFLQGIATGAAITTLSAALVDLERAPGRAGVVNSVAPVGGLAVGALGSGALVEFAPWPTRLVYLVLLVASVLAAVAVAVMPEPTERRPGALASLRPRVGVPARLRADVLTVAPILIALWALSGLYLSLGPSVVAEVFGLRNHLVGGLVVSVLCATGAVTSFLLRHRSAPGMLVPAAVSLGLGTLITLVGTTTGSAVVAVVGTAVAGLGFGAGSLATFGTFARIAAPHERGALFAVVYVIAYLAFSVPAVAAGFATGAVGLLATTEVYAIAVIALTVIALLLRLVLHRRTISPRPDR